MGHPLVPQPSHCGLQQLQQLPHLVWEPGDAQGHWNGQVWGWELQSEQVLAWLLQQNQVQVLGWWVLLVWEALFQLLLLELLWREMEADWTDWAQARALPFLVQHLEAQAEQD